MKKLTILLFSILISFSSYGEWTKVTKNTDGDTFYIEKSTIKESNGYVYYWQLTNLPKPDSDGDKSIKRFNKVDCDMVRNKSLSVTGYSEFMGSGKLKNYPARDDWRYKSPDSVGSTMISYACNYVK